MRFGLGPTRIEIINMSKFICINKKVENFTTTTTTSTTSTSTSFTLNSNSNFAAILSKSKFHSILIIFSRFFTLLKRILKRSVFLIEKNA